MNAPWTPQAVVEPIYGPADMKHFAATQMEVALMLGHVRPASRYTACADCVFFFTADGERLGECRLSAPRQDRSGYAHYARITSHDGCGEGEVA